MNDLNVKIYYYFIEKIYMNSCYFTLFLFYFKFRGETVAFFLGILIFIVINIFL